MARGRRNLVFDLDGTLVDSAADLGRALDAVLAEDGRGPVPLAAVRTMIGDGVAALVQRAFAHTGAPLDRALLPARIARFLTLYAAGGHVLTLPYPGVVDTLGELRARGLRLAICTNKPMALTTQLLDVLGLAPLFDAVTGGDSLPARKPDPDHLLGTLALVGAGPGEAVMIGDSANDVAVARAAGVPVAVVTWGYTRVPPDQLGADLLVDAFPSLLTWFDA